MFSDLIHDSVRVYAVGLSWTLAGAVMVVLGSLIWSETSASARPEGSRRGEKLADRL